MSVIQIINTIVAIQILQIMDSVSDWQHPFVDIFKKYNTFDAPRSFKGSVNIIQDPVIARKCFKLSGSILSNNSITIPDPTSDIKHCNLTGRYIYVEFFALPEKLFCIHFQIGIKDRQPGVRLTLSNMDKQYTVVGGNTLKIPFHVDGRNLWNIVCIDIQHHLENFGLFSKGVIKNYAGIHTVRGVQICANLVVRGIYTSSNIYDWETLPKEMSFKMVRGGKWSESYNFAYLPSTINPEKQKLLKKQDQPGSLDLEQSIVQREQTTQRKKRPQMQQSKLPNNQNQTSKLQSQPLAELTSVFSFSSLHNPDIIFKNNQIYQSGGSIIIRRNIQTGEQLFLQGHTDYIVAMDSFENWIVSVQDGAKAGVRIWIQNKCVSNFQCPYEKVQQIRLSSKKHLAMVGLDQYKRQVILVFDISQIETTRKPVLLGKQISDFNITTLKFSPVDSNKLVSCGKQNIRFWRVKNQHLPGTPVVLNHHARNTAFTVFDFQYFYDDPNPLKQKSQIRRIYVGSQSGLLFQVNYQTHELEEVYKLHDNCAISSIVVSAGFCITGSQDQLIRVWQMDFSEYMLEASNDGVVTSLALNQSSSLVACGTSTGTLSILDLTNNNFKIIVRSHTANVSKICYHSFSNSMITLSNDLTIRLWDVDRLQQTYEFNYPNTDICTCISGNPQALQFVAGFKSGVMRIFDIQTTSVVQQISHHDSPIIHVQYSPDGHFLAVLQQKLNMLYSPLHSHQPVKHLPVQLPSKYKHSCFSDDSEFIYLIGDSGTHINIWNLKSLQLFGKIFTGKVIKRLKSQGDKLWAIMQDTSIRRYNMSQYTVEVEMQALHRQSVNGIDFNLNDHLLYSVGDDSLLKIWDYSFLRQPHQVFIGHANYISDVIYYNQRLWTIGSQGVLVWSAQKPQQQFIPPPVFKKQRKAQLIKNTSYNQQRGDKENRIQNEESRYRQQDDVLREAREAPKPKIMFSNLMKKNANNDDMADFAPQKIDMTFAPKSINLKKVKKREAKAILLTKSTPINQEYDLPLKHFFQQQLRQNQLEYTRKIEMIKQNSKKYNLQYLTGIEPFAHNHAVWNFMYGWYAYVYDNLIIVQSLGKNRSQRIITMPQKIGSMLLTHDFKRLVCVSEFNPSKKQKLDLSASSEDLSQASGSDAGGQVEKESASIYVLGQDLSIERKFEFHPRGVQAIALSKNSKYLVSIGNFRQCTVCVWDFQTGKLKASSYTLDKLNDIAIMDKCGEGRLLEFATVGRDQIHFWAFTKDEKIEYYDVFIQKQEGQQEVPELTSCSFLSHDDQSTYLICGTSTGQVLIVKYGDFNITWRKKICSGQIMDIKCHINRAIIASSDGNIYFWNYNTRILETEPNPNFNKLNLYYSVTGLYFDTEGNQGTVVTTQAIYYVNLVDQMQSLLVGGSPESVIFAKVINQQYLLTSHTNGRLKLWNLETAQQLKTYKWRYPCTQAYYDEGLGKLVCFCKNQSIKIVSIKKFTKQENYLPEELVKVTDPKTDDYVFNCSFVQFGGKSSKWVFTKKGSVYELQIGLEGKKKVVKMHKVLELNFKLKDVCCSSQKNLMLAISQAGEVSAYNVDLAFNDKYSLLLVDRCPASQFNLEKKKTIVEQQALDIKHVVRVCPSKIINETYVAISEESQYLYFRNYMKRITFQKILLNSFPKSILLKENKKDSQVVVGFREGSIMSINAIDPEHRTRYEGIVNNEIQQIFHLKNKNWILACYPSAMGFYSVS